MPQPKREQIIAQLNEINTHYNQCRSSCHSGYHHWWQLAAADRCRRRCHGNFRSSVDQLQFVAGMIGLTIQGGPGTAHL